MVEIELKSDWAGHKAGQTIKVDAARAASLRRRGIAKKVPAKKAKKGARR